MNATLAFFIFDPMYFLFLIPALLISLWAQMKVKSTYAAASKVRAAAGLSGAETARAILDAHGLSNVRVEQSQGFLSDHYDPRNKVLRLSPQVFQGNSVASAGIAAHEAGHALQDAKGYLPLKLRSGLVPFAAIGGNLSMFLILGGFLLGGVGAGAGGGIGAMLLWGGVIAFSLTVLFQLVTLPVEFDASKRAKDLLQSTGLIQQGEQSKAMNRMLTAAALTYVAAALSAIATLAYYLFIIFSSQNR